MDTHEATIAFAAISQETRIRLMRLLTTPGASGSPAGELAAGVAVPASTLSFHLAALERAGLVQSTRRGKQLLYSPRPAGLRALMAFTAEICGATEWANAPWPPAEETEPPMAAAFNVLFLCQRNSARSVIAEAVLEKVGGDRFRAHSAGPLPAPAPLPQVLELLRRQGHDVTRLRSKSWREFGPAAGQEMDFVITLCDMPAGRPAPEFGKRAVNALWPLPDPARFSGSAIERDALLNELYRGIRRRLEAFCRVPFAALDRAAAAVRLEEIGETHATARGA